jgi:hypothetical protein
MIQVVLLGAVLAAITTATTLGSRYGGGRLVFVAIASLVLWTATVFFGLRPVLALDSGGLWITIVVAAAIGLVLRLAALMLGDGASSGLTVRHGIALIGMLALALVWFGTTSAFFHAEAYTKLIEVEEVAYDHRTPILPQERVQMVDARRAGIRASELIGAHKGYGSVYGFGDFRIAIVKGEPVWIAPLVNTRFLAKWTGETTPGIVVVSAHDDREAYLMDRHPISIHGPDKSFLNNIERHLWFGGYSSTFLTDYALEVDDDYKPFWIASKYVKKIGFAGLEVVGVVVTDAATGEIHEYGIADAPKWIDIIQPSDIAVENLTYAGLYIHGWQNAVFQGVDVIHPNEVHSIVQRIGGSIAYYAGMMTQTSQNGGTSGFTLMDTRYNKATVFTTPGITEQAAMEALEGIYQAEKYGATYPRLYMIAGRPTLVSVMVDASGNPKGVGMVSQETRSVFGGGKTVEEARRAYVSRFASFNGGNLDETASTTAKFVVDRIGYNVAGGETVAILVPPKATASTISYFSVPASKFVEILVTEKGDEVELGYVTTPTGEAVVSSFQNARFAAPAPVVTVAPSPYP